MDVSLSLSKAVYVKNTGFDTLTLTFVSKKKPAALLQQAFALNNPIITIFGTSRSKPGSR
jgi:hypothetical protein